MKQNLQFNHPTAVTQWVSNSRVKGFLNSDEGEALYDLALNQSSFGACLEIGSYCGKSTIYLAAAASHNDGVVYAVDHHRGSEEHQRGEAYHDHSLYDVHANRMNSFPEFEKNLEMAGVYDAVVPLVASSDKVARHWQTPLALVFIDGGHSPDMAMRDVMQWSQHIMLGGVMAIHDIFEHPEEGGQGPFLAMSELLASQQFALQSKVNTMAILKRVC